MYSILLYSAAPTNLKQSKAEYSCCLYSISLLAPLRIYNPALAPTLSDIITPCWTLCAPCKQNHSLFTAAES